MKRPHGTPFVKGGILLPYPARLDHASPLRRSAAIRQGGSANSTAIRRGSGKPETVPTTESVLPLGVNEGRVRGFRRGSSLAGALVLFAAMAGAEVQGPPDPRDYRRAFHRDVRPEISLWKPALVYAAGNLADAVTGVSALGRARGVAWIPGSGRENNHMGDPWLVAGVSFVVEVLLDLAAQRWAPAWASRFLRGAALAAYASFGLHNHRAAREQTGP